MSQKLYKASRSAYQQIRVWLGENPNMNPNIAARRAAFQLTGFRVDARELINLDTGDVLEGPELKHLVREGVPPPTNALQTSILNAQFREARNRRHHYAGFEHTLVRMMGFATVMPVRWDAAEALRESRLDQLRHTLGTTTRIFPTL